MADNKRQSGAKVATPKIGGAKDMVDMGESLYKAIGARYAAFSLSFRAPNRYHGASHAIAI
jgi:hypothetical protein